MARKIKSAGRRSNDFFGGREKNFSGDEERGLRTEEFSRTRSYFKKFLTPRSSFPIRPCGTSPSPPLADPRRRRSRSPRRTRAPPSGGGGSARWRSDESPAPRPPPLAARASSATREHFRSRRFSSRWHSAGDCEPPRAPSSGGGFCRRPSRIA